MAKRGASILLVLALQALLLVAGTSAARAAGDLDVLRLPSDITQDLAARLADDEERPWKCCDLQICTRSWPPICWCRDLVLQCDNGCKDCEQSPALIYPPRYICKDSYRGDEAPTCKEEDLWNKILRHHAAAARSSGPAKTAKEEAKDQKKSTVGGEQERRPWQCCNTQICTKSQPPICSCHDTVLECDNACKKCEPAMIAIYPPRYVCKDAYRGDPAPMCNTEALEGSSNNN